MKVKEIDRTANIAWSPASHHPIYLAAGTAAQQLDATFSTTAALEIYSLNLTEPGLDMCMKGSAVSDFRFHKIVWGCEGMKTSEHASGVIVGGADGGNITIYDAAKLIQGDSAVIHQNTKHTGPVHSLDFNKFQDCLFASGASESEIFIWDLNNPSAPVTLGAKSQPLEDVTCVAWNCQVQHILASTFPARCVVWDLRKNEPIIKVSDSSSRLRCKVVAWHPEVATQLCIASEDDHSPLIQLWDLRFATSPLKTLEHHQRGVLSIAWCQQDPDLLLSCGKDNRILCWNPNSNVENGEVLCELPAGSQWSFDIAWCPRNPAIIANSSCDGHVGVFSLMGGQEQVQCSSKIAESFPGSDKMMQPPNVEAIQRHISVPLQKPPKWVRKPVGASFGFGGKLVFFGDKANNQGQQPDQFPSRLVHITQVVTEPDVLSKSEKLESSLANGNLLEFCQNKVDSSQDEHERITWDFLQATFSNAPRTKMLSLLGYDFGRVVAEITNALQGKTKFLDQVELDEQMSNLSTSDVFTGNSTLAFDSIAMNEKGKEEPITIKTDPSLEVSDLIQLEKSPTDTDGLISQALLTGNLPSAVEICIQDGRWADALVLAQAGGLELLQKTQKLYFKAVNTHSSKLISAVVTTDWVTMVKSCDINCWKEMLAAILTYAKPDDFPQLCELLGQRLENDSKLKQNASLCYISAGNLERLAHAWANVHENQDINSLQCLIEQVMVLRRAVEQMSGSTPPLQTGLLSSLLGRYAEILATQGNLSSAATYLVDPNERTLAILRDRIYQALGHRTPQFPFQRVDVRRSSSVSSVHSQHPPQTQSMLQGRRQSGSYQAQHPSFYSSAAPSVANTFTYSNTTSAPMQYQPPPAAPQISHPTYNTVPSAVPPPVPNTAPPPPDSANPSKNLSGPHHLSQRYPRHLHDPSVYSENTYSSQSYFQPPQPAFPTQHPPAEPGPFQPPASTFYSPPDQSGSFGYNPPVSNVSSYPPTSYNTYMPPGSQAPVSTPPPSSVPAPLPSCYNEVKPGWNDPPPVKQTTIKPQQTNFENMTPITSPFPDVPAPQPTNQPPGIAPGGYFVPSFPNMQQQQQQQQPPHPGMIITNAPNQMPEEPKMIPQSAPEPPKEKGPILPEHQVLQDIFEDLRRQCQQVATNPQTRRKLDDVAKKLENLYDKLRDNTLSNQVTLGLHQIVQAIMQSDYAAALSVHGHLVQNANFSEISGFMPSIKVLLQTASHLNVFLQ